MSAACQVAAPTGRRRVLVKTWQTRRGRTTSALSDRYAGPTLGALCRVLARSLRAPVERVQFRILRPAFGPLELEGYTADWHDYRAKAADLTDRQAEQLYQRVLKRTARAAAVVLGRLAFPTERHARTFARMTGLVIWPAEGVIESLADVVVLPVRQGVERRVRRKR